MNEGSGDSSHCMVDIVDLAKCAISLSGLKKDAQYTAETEEAIRAFLHDPTQTTLVASINDEQQLRIDTDIASNFTSAEFVYMLKAPDVTITPANFHTNVQTGSVLGEFINAALNSYIR